MGHLCKKNVHLTLNAQPNFQFLVNPADASIKEITGIGQVFGIIYIEDVVHHQNSGRSFCHVAALTDFRSFEVDEEVVTVYDNSWVDRPLATNLHIVILVLLLTSHNSHTSDLYTLLHRPKLFDTNRSLFDPACSLTLHQLNLHHHV